MNSKHEYLYLELLKRHCSPAEANTLLELDARFGLSSIKRKWRKQAEENEKNRSVEQEFKSEYSIYETAKSIRQEKETNLSIF